MRISLEDRASCATILISRSRWARLPASASVATRFMRRSARCCRARQAVARATTRSRSSAASACPARICPPRGWPIGRRRRRAQRRSIFMPDRVALSRVSFAGNFAHHDPVVLWIRAQQERVLANDPESVFLVKRDRPWILFPDAEPEVTRVPFGGGVNTRAEQPQSKTLPVPLPVGVDARELRRSLHR